MMDKGFKFKCTGCGKCCTGAPGFVWVTPQEIAALATLLNLTTQEFSKRYVRRVGHRFSLVERKDGDCIFLKDKKLCTVYQARPKQCKTYPFWPQVLKSKESWEAEKTYCEGIDHEEGDLYTEEEVKQMLEKNYGEGDRH